jgi:hypothetical protein
VSTITFDQIHARVAAHQAREAARHTPIAVARRAAFTLRSVLSDLNHRERHEVMALLAEETADLAPVVA